MKHLGVIVLVCIVGLGRAEEDKEFWWDILVYKDALEFVRGCGGRELGLCVKERALRYLDNMPTNMDLGGGLKIRGNRAERNSRQTVDLPSDLRAREEAVENMLWESVVNFMRTHTFEFKIPDEAINDLLGKPVEEARKKKGGGGGMRMKTMLLLLQLKAATIGAIALKLIGLIAFKALVIAKIAFTIASIIALKKLLESKHHTSTYEVVAHPHYEEHGHFDRSFNSFNPQDFAYRSYNALGGRSSN
ncbi:unnamed protein product [Phyllotreta striolata]|uniref:Uncharacterized protein n=1 Tax=Phyllotreta striolata TaxID=444603 RepID=A0A9N9XSU7_PHYSR|nr:unnamed protein product [Phyllotreta striolata]